MPLKTTFTYLHSFEAKITVPDVCPSCGQKLTATDPEVAPLLIARVGEEEVVAGWIDGGEFQMDENGGYEHSGSADIDIDIICTKCNYSFVHQVKWPHGNIGPVHAAVIPEQAAQLMLETLKRQPTETQMQFLMELYEAIAKRMVALDKKLGA